jgi:hypothetical protein
MLNATELIILHQTARISLDLNIVRLATFLDLKTALIATFATIVSLASTITVYGLELAWESETIDNFSYL